MYLLARSEFTLEYKLSIVVDVNLKHVIIWLQKFINCVVCLQWK